MQNVATDSNSLCIMVEAEAEHGSEAALVLTSSNSIRRRQSGTPVMWHSERLYQQVSQLAVIRPISILIIAGTQLTV